MTDARYSQSPAPKFDAVEDVIAHFGGRRKKRWEAVSAGMSKVKSKATFVALATDVGITGLQIEAWWDHYHGEGSFKQKH